LLVTASLEVSSNRFELLFIIHDLRVAAKVCGRVAVMQRGVIVEQGETADVFDTPKHPHTKSLLDSIPGRHWLPPGVATRWPSALAHQHRGLWNAFRPTGGERCDEDVLGARPRNLPGSVNPAEQVVQAAGAQKA
jgi:hypothetical protein